MKSIILTLVFLFTWMLQSVDAQELSLKDIQRAACRVRVGGGMGSGTVFAKDAGKYYIISNDHVTGSSRTCNVDFYYDGYRSVGVPGDVIWHRRSSGAIQYDMSIITIPESAFGDNPEDHPIIIPIAPRDTVIKRDDYIFGCGNPQGLWLYSWQSRVLSVTDRINFNRPPIGGESGSSILTNVNGKTMIIGLVTWSISPPGQPGYGGGVHLEALHRAFIGEAGVEGKFPHQTLDQYSTPVVTQEQYKHIHAKGSDGKVYSGREYASGRKTALDMPVGVRVIEYTQCPDGNCPNNPGGGGMGGLIPFLGGNREAEPIPPQQGGRSGGGLWPNKPPIGIGDSKPPETKPTVPAVDNSKIKELEAKIKELQDQVDKLVPLNKELEDKLKSVTDQLSKALVDKEGLNTELEKLKQDKDELDSKLKEFEGVTSKNEQLLTEKKDLLDKSFELDGKLKVALESVEKTKVEIGSLKELLDKAKANEMPNVSVYVQQMMNGDLKLSHGLIMLAIGFGGWWFGKRYGSSSRINLIIGLARILGQKYILHNDNTVGLKEESEEDKKKSEITDPECPDVVYNNVEKITPVTTPVDIKINNTVVSNPQSEDNKDKVSGVLPENRTSDYIIGWGQNREKDGEDIGKTALFAGLYREAVNKLRKGEFVKDGYSLNFQKLAAEKIDEYVKSKFHLNMTIDKLTRDQKYNEAMIAFLYKEAIELLRQGKFEVLGNEQLADAIDSYVKTEFYKRLGVNFR